MPVKIAGNAEACVPFAGRFLPEAEYFPPEPGPNDMHPDATQFNVEGYTQAHTQQPAAMAKANLVPLPAAPTNFTGVAQLAKLAPPPREHAHPACTPASVQSFGLLKCRCKFLKTGKCAGHAAAVLGRCIVNQHGFDASSNAVDIQCACGTDVQSMKVPLG